MNNNNGLADNQDGEIILNESGTSISTGATEGETESKTPGGLQRAGMENKTELTLKTEDPVILNDIASDEHSRMGEGIIKPYDDVFADHRPQEDNDEILGTDNV